MKKKLGSLLSICFVCVGVAWGLSTQTGQRIIHSTIDSTPIGINVPAAIVATSTNTTTLNTGTLTVNNQAPTNHTLCGNGSSYADSSTPCTTPTTVLSGNLSGLTRFPNTIYQNTSGTRMTVNVTPTICCGGTQAGEWDVYIGATSSVQFFECATTSNGTGVAGLSAFVVPPNYYYEVINGTVCGGTGGSSLHAWWETLN